MVGLPEPAASRILKVAWNAKLDTLSDVPLGMGQHAIGRQDTLTAPLRQAGQAEQVSATLPTQGLRHARARRSAPRARPGLAREIDPERDRARQSTVDGPRPGRARKIVHRVVCQVQHSGRSAGRCKGLGDLTFAPVEAQKEPALPLVIGGAGAEPAWKKRTKLVRSISAYFSKSAGVLLSSI